MNPLARLEWAAFDALPASTRQVISESPVPLLVQPILGRWRIARQRGWDEARFNTTLRHAIAIAERRQQEEAKAG